MIDKNLILKKITEKLELNESQFNNIKKSYNAVAKWLNDSEKIKKFGETNIFVQGSVALGTVVRPLKRDEYDIDLVFYVNNNYIKASDLKKIIGDRLKENEVYKKMLDDEGKRCWTLNYSDNLNYHMDILPTKKENNSIKYCGIESISATNLNKTTGIYTEKSTNPKGYLKWFLDKTNFRLNENYRYSIENIEEYPFKTVLQKTVQLLKRHRDVFFDLHHIDYDIPLSIIITTLAALSYNGENDLADCLYNISINMEKGINLINDRIYIYNPVDKRENFAEKWNENNNKFKNFNLWLNKLKDDTKKLKTLNGFDFNDIIKTMFGENIVKNVWDDIGDDLYQTRSDQGLSFDNSSGKLYKGTDNIIRNHTFFGK